MRTLEDHKIRYFERMAIMTENGKTENEAHAQATYEVRKDMVEDGIDFGAANLKVSGIKSEWKKL